jgi:hypothetical protein
MQKVKIYRKAHFLDGFSKFTIFKNNKKIGCLYPNQFINIDCNLRDIIVVKYFFLKSSYKLSSLSQSDEIVISFDLNKNIFWIYSTSMFALGFTLIVTKELFFLFFSIFINILYLFYSFFYKKFIIIYKN